MRLLNTNTLTLKFFLGENKPQYAILSHTWGNDEILFEDVSSGGLSQLAEESPWSQEKESLAKVLGSCQLASRKGYDWIWIDTCCIDKSSSAELSEAINSMFRWYEKSAICYAYLSDVYGQVSGQEMSCSRWFSRGWTLQELIAPPNVEFFSAFWEFVGDRNSKSVQIAEFSGIDDFILRHGHHRRCAYIRDAKSDHVTKDLGEEGPTANHTNYRNDHLAYGEISHTTSEQSSTKCDCNGGTYVGVPNLTTLLARTRLFDVNMPLIYGEGSKAFSRLLREIAQISDDQSILTWQSPVDRHLQSPSSPECYPINSIFPASQWTFAHQTTKTNSLATSNNLQVDIMVCSDFVKFSGRISLTGGCLGILDCTVGSDLRARPAVKLEKAPGVEDVYYLVSQKGYTYVVQMPDMTRPNQTALDSRYALSNVLVAVSKPASWVMAAKGMTAKVKVAAQSLTKRILKSQKRILKSEKRDPGEIAELCYLERDGIVKKLWPDPDYVNLRTAKMRKAIIKNFFITQEGTESSSPIIVGTRICLDNAHGYSVAHCVPDIRPDRRTRCNMVIPRTWGDQWCMLFLESASGPPFTVAWRPYNLDHRWLPLPSICLVNSISNLKQICFAGPGHLYSDEEYWERAKGVAQKTLQYTIKSRLLSGERTDGEPVLKDTLKLDGVEITAELADESFLSQRIDKLHISIEKSS
ncbi:hypothetical protein PG989_004475 [Apiospora arundinis]